MHVLFREQWEDFSREIQVVPQKFLPRGTSLFLPQTEFQSQNGLFHDITFLTTDSILIGQFRDSIWCSVIAEIIWPDIKRNGSISCPCIRQGDVSLQSLGNI